MRAHVPIFVSLAVAVAAHATAEARPEPRPAASGETQVVAKAGGREITLTDLRAEIARLQLPLNDPGAERIALASVIERALLAGAARAASVHRRPEALIRMKAAEEQALADFYLALSSQPPEPTPDEIEDFIAANPSLFADRRVYDFAVLTLPTASFDEKALSPLFDEESDFSNLSGALETKGVAYAVSSATQSATAFPKPVREQLARYTTADNIVIKGEAQTQIMKITRAKLEPSPASEWRPLARRILLEEAAGKRAEATLARLKSAAAIAYYRPSAAPPKAAAPKAPPAAPKP